MHRYTERFGNGLPPALVRNGVAEIVNGKESVQRCHSARNIYTGLTLTTLDAFALSDICSGKKNQKGCGQVCPLCNARSPIFSLHTAEIARKAARSSLRERQLSTMAPK